MGVMNINSFNNGADILFFQIFNEMTADKPGKTGNKKFLHHEYFLMDLSLLED